MEVDALKLAHASCLQCILRPNCTIDVGVTALDLRHLSTVRKVVSQEIRQMWHRLALLAFSAGAFYYTPIASAYIARVEAGTNGPQQKTAQNLPAGTAATGVLLLL